MSKVLFIIKSATNVELKYFKYLFLPSGNWNYNQNGVWKCYETSDPTKPAPTRTIPDTSRFFDDNKQMFVYGFSKVSRVKELAQ